MANCLRVSVAVVDRFGSLAHKTRVSTEEPQQLLEELDAFRPLEVVVETCPFWPWIHDLLVAQGIGFHLAHAKELRAIASAPLQLGRPHPTRQHPHRRQPLGPGRSRLGHPQPRALRTRERRESLLRPAQGPTRLARRTRRRSPQADPDHPLHAAPGRKLAR